MIFKRAFTAPVVSMWASSRIYTRYLASTGVKLVSSRRARTSSTRLLEAASCSTTSRMRPSSMPRHRSHSRQGLPF